MDPSYAKDNFHVLVGPGYQPNSEPITFPAILPEPVNLWITAEWSLALLVGG